LGFIRNSRHENRGKGTNTIAIDGARARVAPVNGS